MVAIGADASILVVVSFSLVVFGKIPVKYISGILLAVLRICVRIVLIRGEIRGLNGQRVRTHYLGIGA